MQLFTAYAFTGEDKKTVEARMRIVCDTLKTGGHEVYCNMFAPDYDQLKDIQAVFAHAFAAMRTTDVVIPIIASARRSEGQLIEIGAALMLGKPIYLLQHESATETSYIQELATKTYTWRTQSELKKLAAVLAREL